MGGQIWKYPCKEETDSRWNVGNMQEDDRAWSRAKHEFRPPTSSKFSSNCNKVITPDFQESVQSNSKFKKIYIKKFSQQKIK